MPGTSDNGHYDQRHVRFEVKYLVEPHRLPALRAFLHPFTVPDRVSLRPGTDTFSVCSLYLDSDDLMTYRQAATGELQRFKLRLRTYGDAEDSPVFFEVKRKANGVVSKLRVPLSRDDARAWLNGRPVGRVARGGPDREAAETFRELQTQLRARPVMRVRYRREAYESVPDQSVRITLDTELAYAVTFDGELGHATGRWVVPRVDGVILEVKFTDCLPTWMQEFVRSLALQQRSVPKYGMCIEHLIGTSDRVALSNAGFAAPAGSL